MLVMFSIIIIFFVYKFTIVVKDISINLSLDNASYSLINQQYFKKSMFAFKNEDVKSFIESNFLLYDIVSTKKQYPSSLFINLKKKESKYFIKADKVCYSVSDDFVVINISDCNNNEKVLVEYDRNLELLKKIQDAKLVLALNFYDLKEKVVIKDNTIMMILPSDIKVFLPDNINDVNLKMNVVKNIVKTYTVNNSGIESIDLRFTKPVIRYYNKTDSG